MGTRLARGSAWARVNSRLGTLAEAGTERGRHLHVVKAEPGEQVRLEHRGPRRDVPHEAGEATHELRVPGDGRPALVFVARPPVQPVQANADGGHGDREVDLRHRVPPALVHAAVIARRGSEPTAQTNTRALRTSRSRPERRQPEHGETQHQPLHGSLRVSVNVRYWGALHDWGSPRAAPAARADVDG